MELPTQIRSWLLTVDPARDPLGIRKRQMEALVAELEAELRDAGGPGSGNFGHAGRPGEVGGSASSESASVNAVVAQITGTSAAWPVADTDVRQLGNTQPVEVASHEWQSNLDPNAREAFRYFSLEGHMPINAQLRSGVDYGQADRIARIDHALENAPSAPPPDVVWRGLNGEVGPFIKSVAIGDELELSGYQSATLNPRSASEFATDFPLMLEIKPKRGAYLEGVSRSGGEHEYLLPHNARFRVRGITRATFDLGQGWLSDHETKNYRVIQLEQL